MSSQGALGQSHDQSRGRGHGPWAMSQGQGLLTADAEPRPWHEPWVMGRARPCQGHGHG